MSCSSRIKLGWLKVRSASQTGHFFELFKALTQKITLWTIHCSASRYSIRFMNIHPVIGSRVKGSLPRRLLNIGAKQNLLRRFQAGAIDVSGTGRHGLRANNHRHHENVRAARSAHTKPFSTPTVRSVRAVTSISTRPKPIAGKPIPAAAILSGWCLIVIGRVNSAVLPNSIKK
jgi:hypothetical protein